MLVPDKNKLEINNDMYFDYLKIKIGKHIGLTFFGLIVIALIVIMRVINPLYYESGISFELLLIVTICVGIFLLVIKLIDRYYRIKYHLAEKLSQRILSEYKEPFERKWWRETIVLYLTSKIAIPLSIDRWLAEKVLCHFLPYIFTGDNQSNKAENSFLNLLALLELNKALVMKSQIEMNSESSNGFRFGMAFLKRLEPHRKILSDFGYILVLMQAIAYLNEGNFESFDEEQLEEFFDNWDKATWTIEPFLIPLPKSLNNREFAMGNYADEGFKELVFTFSEYCDTPIPKKEKVPIIGRRLIEKRGNIILAKNRKCEGHE